MLPPEPEVEPELGPELELDVEPPLELELVLEPEPMPELELDVEAPPELEPPPPELELEGPPSLPALSEPELLPQATSTPAPRNAVQTRILGNRMGMGRLLHPTIPFVRRPVEVRMGHAPFHWAVSPYMFDPHTWERIDIRAVWVSPTS